MSQKIKTIEPDTLLYYIELNLDSLTMFFNKLSERKRPHPRLYRDLLARRISLNHFSKQMRTTENIRYN